MAIHDQIKGKSTNLAGWVPEEQGAQDAPKAAAPAVAPTKTAARKGEKYDSIVSDADVKAHQGGVKLGSKSGAIAFKCLLGDPSYTDSFTVRGEKKSLPKIVGYRFEALEDLDQVPDFGTTEAFKGNKVMDAADVTKFRSVAAGETFDLTRVEVAALLTRPEFNFIASGDPENEVKLVLAFREIDEDKEIQSVSDLPDAQMQMVRKGSIKDQPMVNVLEYESMADGKNRFATGKRTMNEEFVGTKFENLAKVGTRTARRGSRGLSGSDKAVQKRLKQGAAFQELLGKVAAAQQNG